MSEDKEEVDWFLLRTKCGCERLIEGVPSFEQYIVPIPNHSAAYASHLHDDIDPKPMYTKRVFKRTIRQYKDGNYIVVYMEE